MHGLGLDEEVFTLKEGEIYRTTYQGPYGHLYAAALNVVLNVNFNEDGTGEIAEGSYYPTETVEDCIADIAIQAIEDDLEYTSNLDAGLTFPSANILGSIPDGEHSHPTEGYTDGSTLIHEGDPAGSISLTQAEFFDLFPSTPEQPCLCDDEAKCTSNGGSGGEGCFDVTLENGQTITGGDPLPGFAGGYVKKGNLPSIAPSENCCADVYVEWHAIDGPISGSGLGDDATDEDGDGTDFDRIWAMESLMATYLSSGPGCGYNYPIFGDVTTQLESMGLGDCIDRVDIATEGYLFNESNTGYGNLVTFNSITGGADDSDHDYNGTDGRLVMEFEPTCIQDINVRHIMLEFIDVEEGESCLDEDDCIGCSDPLAYNCEDSIAGQYINEVGSITYDYSCDGNSSHAGPEDCNAGGICEGYYNPTPGLQDNGSCRYPQAPHGYEVVLTPTETGISVDWSAFTPPAQATLESYQVQRCEGEGCTWVDGFNPGDQNTETLLFDAYNDLFVYTEGEEIKYAIAVKYSNNPYWGWAIGASYVTPCITDGCGCTDEEAYNCDDSIAGEYINEVGPITYNYSCDGNIDHAGPDDGPYYEDCSAEETCEGYYDLEATDDDGSCRYPQAPHGDDVELTEEATGISVDWSSFVSPEKAHIWSYHVQRCVGEGCDWVDGFTPGDQNTTTFLFDEYDYIEGEEIKYGIAVKYSNNPYWGWAIEASYITPCSADLGDVNGDGPLNVQDIVTLANWVLSDECYQLPPSCCAADLNGDGGVNVVDILILVGCVLEDAPSCGGSRVDDATFSRIIINGNVVSIKADGYIGGVQMTLSHSDDFRVEMTERAFIADYLTSGNETRLLVISPETDKLFSYSGDFEITELIVANSHAEVSASLPIASEISLSEPYPNPFNPTTTMTLIMPVAGVMKVEIYNLLGQSITTLTSGYKDAGTYSLTWDATAYSSGVYFITLTASYIRLTQKVLLLK